MLSDLECIHCKLTLLSAKSQQDSPGVFLIQVTMDGGTICGNYTTFMLQEKAMLRIYVIAFDSQGKGATFGKKIHT